jgi:hypothetical protein
MLLVDCFFHNKEVGVRKLAIVIGFVLFAALSCATAGAHEGMVTLFADQAGSDCDADLAPGQSIDLYLFYVRGDGPEIGACCAMRLLSSSPNIAMHSFSQAPPPGERLCIGNINDGISFCNHAGQGPWCETGKDVVFLGAITVMNIFEEGPFTITIVGNPDEPNIHLAITTCDSACSKHAVIGGTFVFNGTCENPEQGAPLGTHDSSWGAIKTFYTD